MPQSPKLYTTISKISTASTSGKGVESSGAQLEFLKWSQPVMIRRSRGPRDQSRDLLNVQHACNLSPLLLGDFQTLRNSDCSCSDTVLLRSLISQLDAAFQEMSILRMPERNQLPLEL